MSLSRQLAAIMFTDIVGYTAMMQENEDLGRSKAQSYRKTLEDLVAKHGGEIVNNYGDGSLTIFHSAVEAVSCAMAIQQGLKNEVPLRVGIHLGDIVNEGGELYGDGINVASRIESMGVAGAILVSGSIYNEIKNHPDFSLRSLGNYEFKNVTEPIEVFALQNDGLVVPQAENLKGKFKERKTTRSPLVYMAMASVAVLLLWGIWSSLLNPGASARVNRVKSIAVLPLQGTVGQEEQSFLQTELHEGLIGTLGQLHGLKIISNASTSVYADSINTPLDAIAKELGVEAILKGSVLGMDDSVNIQLELIRAVPREQQVWSQQYSGTISDVMNIPRDVANQIANTIEIELTSNQQLVYATTDEIDAETYKAYLRGMFFINGSTTEDHQRGVNYLHDAVALDPANPKAYLGLAKGYVTLGHGPNPDDDVWIRAKAAAEQALSLDSTLTEALTVIAIIKMYRDFDLDGAENDLKKALEINPNQSMAHFQYAWLLAVFGRFEEAIYHHKQAKELDPLNPICTSDLGSLYYWAGDLDNALKEAKEGLQIDPEFGHGWWALGNVYVQTGEFDKAIEAHQKASEIHPIWKGALGGTYALSGDKQKAMEIMEEVKRLGLSPRVAFWLAYINMTLGDFDKTFEWLEYQPPDPWVGWIRTWPEFKLLHHDPRFHEFIKKQGLPPI